MTIREIKSMNRLIERLSRKAEMLRSSVLNTSPSLSSAPGGSGVSDKIGKCVAEIADIEQTLNELKKYRDAELRRLSKDIDEEVCIYLFLVRRYTWRKIARITDGRADTAESIRKRCYRYKW